MVGPLAFSFQQVGDRRRSGGLGLGLAFARGFTEAVDGRLAAEDTPGGGLTMVVSVPAATNQPAPLPTSDCG